MLTRRSLSIALGVVLVASGAFAVRQIETLKLPTPTGKLVTVAGDQAEVGSFPDNMVLSPDGKFAITTNTGFRQQLSVIDTKTGKLVFKKDFNSGRRGRKDALYFGLDTLKAADGTTLVAASGGVNDRVELFKLQDDGSLTEERTLTVPPTPNPLKITGYVSGVAFTSDGKYVAACLNQSHAFNNFQGSVVLVPVDGSTPSKTYKVGGFPMAIVATKDGRLYVANEGGEGVTELKIEDPSYRKDIRTGAGPTALILNRDQSKLFVTNANSDTLSVLNTVSDKVEKTVLLRPGELRGLSGTTPLGLALSPSEDTLFVAMADLNAVAVLDAKHLKPLGYLPVGWYPTSLAVTNSGANLLVANAKGIALRHPNDKAVGKLGQYGPNIIEGTVTNVALAEALKDLNKSTEVVLQANHASGNYERVTREAFRNPGIDHVIYVIKENRTFDQVLGDLPRGNVDPSVCLFPRAVTPNQHALVDRFVLADNYYVCAEVSADGWNWSTAGMANSYTERNTFTNYGGRGRDYDFEGTTNNVPLSLRGLRDPAEPQNGYIWDQCVRQGVSIRNYGFFLSNGSSVKGPDGKPLAEENAPDKKNLVGATCADFLGFDLAFADSDAWVKYDLKAAPEQMATYGSQKDRSRMTTFLREFNGYVKSGKLPQFITVRLGRDHTSGTADGQYSPQAMVADNDYAVGQLVDAVSHSPYWKRTAIFVLEDDAQAGFDHVDSHRSTVYVVSPYIKPGTLSSEFYNTDSVLRTMSLLLKIKPVNQYVAGATAMNIFSDTAVNDAPFDAILPSKDIVSQVNHRDAYRSADSKRLIARRHEESLPDMELNDILWGAIKGAKTPRPTHTNAIWSTSLRHQDPDGDGD